MPRDLLFSALRHPEGKSTGIDIKKGTDLG